MCIVVTYICGVIEFTYLKQPPKRFTFEMPKLFRWTVQNCKPTRVLNLFAGHTILFPKSKSDFIETRVDLSDVAPADYHMDAYEFVLMAKKNGWNYDTVIFDPQYNLRKSREKYNGIFTSQLRKIKTDLPSIIASDGIVICYGYDTTGMGRQRGFELTGVCVVNHSGDHNDTLCTIERKFQKEIY